MRPTQQPAYVPLLLLSSISVLPIAAQINNATCYWPNGDVAENTTPCKASGTSACCGADDLCLTNGYCLVSMFVARHSCTDQSFNDPNCPQLCSKDSLPGQAKNLYQCSTTEWACTHPACETAPFHLSVGQIILREKQMPPAVSSSYYTVDAAAAMPASTVAAATTAPAAATTASTASACPSKKGAMAGIGAGVGIPLGIAALAFAALWALERRRSKKASTWGDQQAYNHVSEQKIQSKNAFGYGQAIPMQHGMTPTEDGSRHEAHGEDFRPEVEGQVNRFELAQSPVPR